MLRFVSIYMPKLMNPLEFARDDLGTYMGGLYSQISRRSLRSFWNSMFLQLTSVLNFPSIVGSRFNVYPV